MKVRAAILAGALALSVPVVLGPGSAPALAWGPDPGQGSTSPAPTSDTGAPTYGTVKNCAIVSSSSYLGMSCAGADNGGKTVKQILGDSDVPGCWDEPLSDTELAAMNVQNEPGPHGWTYYWEKCLSGIDPKTKTIGPDGVDISLELKRIPNGDPIKTLDPRQQDLVKALERTGNIPAPVAGMSPAADHARVGSDVSFFDGTPDVVQVDVGSVILRAHVESIDIEPLGPDHAPRISCPGKGIVAEPGDTPTSRPNGCWYRYLHSSAGQPYDQYPVQITAHWVVESSGDGGSTFTVFNRFTKSAITRVPVTEVQALVVQ